RGQGQRKIIEVEKLLRSAYALDVASGGWEIAAELWAQGQVQKPAIVFSEGDLLIAATAAAHERTLVTSDEALAANLLRVGYAGEVEVLAGAKTATSIP